MSRSPFMETGRQRRELAVRRRRRRSRARLLAVTALLAVIGALLIVHHLSSGTPSPAQDSRGARAGRSHAPAAAALPRSPAAPASTGLASPHATPGVSTAPLTLKLTDPHDPVHARFKHQPRSGILFDLDTGRVLWRRDPIRPLPIASLTKMMTALLVVRSAPASAPVRITREALAYQGSGVGVLPRGRSVRLETLLNGLLLPSGNDAAIALAQHVAGTVPRFIARMNRTAQAMGLRCTHFTSVDGFSDAGRSCAVDLAVLARADLDQPRIARVTRRRRAVMPLPIKGGKVFLYNNNPLVKIGYPGITGLKTGYTVAAGLCLVETAQRAGHRLGVVLLNGPDARVQTRLLLDRGFRALR